MAKKKRALKKRFKFLLWLFLVLLIIFGIYFLNQRNIINLNSFLNNISDLKEKKTENDVAVIDENLKEHNFIQIFRNRLPSKNLNFASSSEIYPNGDMKIFLQDTEDSLGYLYVNTNNDAEYVWITFVSAMDAEPLKSEVEKKIKYLDYIDLRFSNKIFYKFKDLEAKIVEPLAEIETFPAEFQNSTTSSTTSTTSNISTTTTITPNLN